MKHKQRNCLALQKRYWINATERHISCISPLTFNCINLVQFRAISTDSERNVIVSLAILLPCCRALLFDLKDFLLP